MPNMRYVHCTPALYHHSEALFPGGYHGITRHERSSSQAFWPFAERLPQIGDTQTGETVKHARISQQICWCHCCIFLQINPRAMSCAPIHPFSDEYCMIPTWLASQHRPPLKSQRIEEEVNYTLTAQAPINYSLSTLRQFMPANP